MVVGFALIARFCAELTCGPIPGTGMEIADGCNGRRVST
jgi:hypothetical protein